jgi:hypothetical protein
MSSLFQGSEEGIRFGDREETSGGNSERGRKTEVRKQVKP